jgi:hypothetical protein
LLSTNINIKIYGTIILLVVLYGCETWSLTLREKRRLRVFENRVLRRVFGPKRDEVTGEWRKLHNEELSDLYCTPNIVRVIKSRRMKRAGHVARMGKREACTGFWWENLKERARLEETGVHERIILRSIFRKKDVGGMDWIDLAQDRDMWRALVNSNELSDFSKNTSTNPDF